MASILQGRLLGETVPEDMARKEWLREDRLERLVSRGYFLGDSLGKTTPKASIHFKRFLLKILRVLCSW